MKTNPQAPKNLILLLAVSCTAILLVSCSGQLTNKKAEKILKKSYAGSYHPDEAGGSHTVIESITIDSIHQAGDTALVFYRVSGKVENGSKYQKDIDEGEQEQHFTRGTFGWKQK